MVHGGAYPAITDSRSSSVGSMTIFRFARSASHQHFADIAPPRELQNGNPIGI
jgi:2,5-dioxopentanoate dehydrogenase